MLAQGHRSHHVVTCVRSVVVASFLLWAGQRVLIGRFAGSLAVGAAAVADGVQREHGEAEAGRRVAGGPSRQPVQRGHVGHCGHRRQRRPRGATRNAHKSMASRWSNAAVSDGTGKVVTRWATDGEVSAVV